jgi:hypothetical protein
LFSIHIYDETENRFCLDSCRKVEGVFS